MTVDICVSRWLHTPGEHLAEQDILLRNADAGTSAIEHSLGGAGLLALPAPVNAHDHGMGVRCLDFGSYDDALEPWIAWLRVRPPTDPYLEALVAFGRLALAGCSATMHCHNSLNAERLVEEAGEVVRAARTCGIRLAFSCPLLDTSPWIYDGADELQPHLSASEWSLLKDKIPCYPPVSEQLAAVDAVARDNQSNDVSVQLGPIGPQWASNDLLEAIADVSAHNGRRIHMHLLESPRQRHWLDKRFPQGIVNYLDDIGFLSPRLAVAHGVQLRPEECELLAARGVTLVSNPSANLRLRSGIAPIEVAHSLGVPLALGLDGTGFDDDQDIWREMRLFRLLQNGCEMVPRLAHKDIFAMVLSNGAAVLETPVAKDLAVVDFEALTQDAIFDDLDEASVILGRMSAQYVRHLLVNGQYVVRDGRLTGFDFSEARNELTAQARAVRPSLQRERETATVLAEATRRHYIANYP